MIEFDKVTRAFGHKLAVADLTLKISRGELFAFLGPNGAGKTTTIKMLVGLLRPTAGKIRVGGFDTAEQTRQATQLMGYVPDQPYLYDKLSGREFLDFVAEMRGLDRNRTAEAIDRESRRFEMRDFLDDLAETYSHGMKQRLVFAAALLHGPAVLVVDEPMVGLDPKSMKMVKDLLRELASAGTIVFMSTHTLNVAEEIADRIGIIDCGQLGFLGTLEELQARRLAAGGRGAASRTSLEQLFLELTSNHGEPGGNHHPPGSRRDEPGSHDGGGAAADPRRQPQGESP
jgi:ABC-2 type transport system ATP-binding protein